MPELFEFIAEKPKRKGDLSLGVILSIAFHITALIWIATRHYQELTRTEIQDPVRYVEIIPEMTQQFTEAPGPAVQEAPPRAPLSDANRRAATPRPTGPEPTTRPGDGVGFFDGGPRGAPPQPPPSSLAQPRRPSEEASPDAATESREAEAIEQRAEGIQPFREQEQKTATDAPEINWQSALRQMQREGTAKPAPPRVGDWRAGGHIGGNLGSADTGTLSFESAWFEWGDYAAKMIARIRVHWYANIPELIRLGVRGTVTIRFTIQRDGTITNLRILDSSGTPPLRQRRKTRHPALIPPAPAA